MSIVHMDKIWVKIAKHLEMWTSGGKGVFSDFGHPSCSMRGEGVKKGKFLQTSFMLLCMAPYKSRITTCILRFGQDLKILL